MTSARSRLRVTFSTGWYSRFVEPTISGLPNWRVLAWFPTLVALGAIVLVALHISGTSSGAYWATFGVGDDPQALLGGPRPIRSDEWLVHQGWILSQYQQGFPAVNGTFPGGMDATVGQELPAWEWSSIFRPHVWGYLLFGPDAGLAWQWWIPAFALVTSCYLFVVTILPRRAVTAAVIACAFYFTPLFQWWYGPSTLWPAAWVLLAMAGTTWMLRSERLRSNILWAVPIAWLAVTVAFGLYIPFILPAFLVFFAFFVGSVAQASSGHGRGGFRGAAKRLVPLGVAGAAAAGVLVIWITTRIDTITAITSTVYPGQRSEPTGQLLVQDAYLTRLGGAVWGQSFHSSGGPTLLGPNASESSTALLLGVFLLPALVWLAARAWRSTHTVEWVLVAIAALVVLILAYLLIPGWDALARLLFLDRVPVGRIKMAFAVLVPVVFTLVIREVDRRPRQSNRVLAAVTIAVTAAFNGTLLCFIVTLNPELLQESDLWPVALIALLGSLALLFHTRTVPIAAVLLLVTAMVIGAAVNPLYRGAFELDDTDIGQAVHETDSAEPGTWVGVGSYAVMGLMMESGVQAYSGVQMSPSEEMWDAIDPNGSSEEIWNRLAHVRWTFGPGEPELSNASPDTIIGTFDACSDFAQEHVDYVLANEPTLTNDCLVQLADITQGHSRMQIYRVTSP